jgi:uncharacterized protein (DUF2384 family)
MAHVRNIASALPKPRPWTPAPGQIRLRPAAIELLDIHPLLIRVVDALGTNAAARILGADRAQVSRWRSRKERIGAEMARRIIDFHDVLTRVLQIFDREAAAMWLVGSEPLLGGSRPVDVLAIEGAAPVIQAIDGIAQGAYA